MAAQTCTPSSLADAGAGIAMFSKSEFKGVLNYLLAKWLQRLGGTNYNADYSALILAAVNWPQLDPAQQQAAILEILRSVAVDDGATIPTSASDLLEAAQYLINTPDQDSVTLFLLCAIGGRM